MVPYETTGGHSIALLRQGNLNINQMFSAEHFDARLETWKFRGIGVFILYASSVCLSRILKIMCELITNLLMFLIYFFYEDHFSTYILY